MINSICGGLPGSVRTCTSATFSSTYGETIGSIGGAALADGEQAAVNSSNTAAIGARRPVLDANGPASMPTPSYISPPRESIWLHYLIRGTEMSLQTPT